MRPARLIAVIRTADRDAVKKGGDVATECKYVGDIPGGGSCWRRSDRVILEYSC